MAQWSNVKIWESTREKNVIQTSSPLVNLQNMLSCTKGSLNHLVGCDSLKENRGKVAVINIEVPPVHWSWY